MGLISSIPEAFKYATGTKEKHDVLVVRFQHSFKCVEAALKTASATTLAFAVGFLVPNAIGEIWWPKEYSVEALMNESGAVRIGFALFFSCWAFKKTLPKLTHHVNMVINPENEVYAKLRRDLQALFDDLMRFLVTMLICAAPLYLGFRTFQWLSLK